MTRFIQWHNLILLHGKTIFRTMSVIHLVCFDFRRFFSFLPETTTWHNSSENSFRFSNSLSWCLATVSSRLAGSLPQLLTILITSSYCLSIVSLMSVPDASMVRIKWRQWCSYNEIKLISVFIGTEKGNKQQNVDI